jgi:hypothetical protein
VVIVSSVVVFLGLFYWVAILPNISYVPRLLRIEQLIDAYIVENGGCFPLSRHDLEEKGIIKVNRNSDGSYDIRDVLNGGWKDCPLEFDKFVLDYGVTAEGLELRDSVLHDRQSGRERLLISGPRNHSFPGSLRPTYRRMSVHWYNAMLKAETQQ